MSIAASRCCSADRQERKKARRGGGGQRETEGEAMRWRMREGGKRESRRERVFCVCSCLGDREDGEQNRMYSVCLCAFMCVFWYTVYVLQLVHSAHVVRCVYELLNAFAWPNVKKRIHGER